ncbi:MAG TPA: sigma-54 dependent transcriptional regulator [Gemmatimonadales bacterium]
MSKPKILIVDDEAPIRFAVRDFLELQDFEILEADGCAAAEDAAREGRPDAAVLDYGLPDGNALELLPRLKAIDPDLPVVILTGQGTIDLAVRAIKEGADHFLVKPVELPALLVLLHRLLERERTSRRDRAGEARRVRGDVDPFLSSAPAMRRLAEQAARMADADSPVLILGETGAGKGVIARWLHQHSPRAREAFVDVNCAGLSRELLESELFGYAKGAFTGAAANKTGLLEVAHRGTVFLDEIGDVDPLVQPKLLTVLEEKRFRRLGDVRDRSVDLRLVAATSRDVNRMAQEQKFRSDLYFRISTLVLRIPPLRERAGDIPVLAAELLERLAQERGRRSPSLSGAAVAALQAYPWPGNVRELRNVLERAVLLSAGGVLGTADLHFDSAPAPSGVSPVAAAATTEAALTLGELERQHIERVLQDVRGRVAEAAKRLGIPRSTLYQKIRELRIEVSKS